MTPSVLVIDDEEVLRKALEKFLGRSGFEVVLAKTAEEGLTRLQERTFDLLLADLMLPGMSGIELLRQGQSIQPHLTTIMMTGYGTIPSAIEAIKAGAFHYVTKPFELEDLHSLISKGLENRRLREENIALRQALKTQFNLNDIVGSGPAMQEVFRLVSRVAPTDSTVLILGESGTGKELLAKAIHSQSPRAERPLVTVNCAAIPETLLESELFGHMKGAFTGAISTHIGRFEQAHGGTIFLDEIGDMSPRLQVKVLRVLQERRFDPVGSTKTRVVDVRILAATNRNLERLVREGQFREDLYYRLNVIPMTLMPLRERKEDIPLLIRHFLAKASQETHKSIEQVNPEAMQRLAEYDWPGNIRELENLVERMVVLAKGTEIGLADLPPSLLPARSPEFFFENLTLPAEGVSLKTLLARLETTLIQKALEKSEGNKNKAAALLQLNRTTLIEKMKKREPTPDESSSS